jgi:hypothetical protein
MGDEDKKDIVSTEPPVAQEAPTTMPEEALRKAASAGAAEGMTTKNSADLRLDAAEGPAEVLTNEASTETVPSGLPSLSQWLSVTPTLAGSAELFTEADRNGLSFVKTEKSLYIADGTLKIADVAGADEASVVSALREVLSRPKYEKLPDNQFSQLAAQIEAEHGNTPIGGALVALLRLAAKYGNFMDSFSTTSFSTDLEKGEYMEKTLSAEELAALNTVKPVKIDEPLILPTYGEREASTLYASAKLFGEQYSISNQKEFAAKLHNSPSYENKGSNKEELLAQGLVPNTVVFFSTGESSTGLGTDFNVRDILTGYVNELGQLSYYDKSKGQEVPVDMSEQSFVLKAAFVPAGALPVASDAVAPDVNVAPDSPLS